jgi:hypothetical protein
MSRFFEEGDKVKVTLRFRGREMAHQHLGIDLLMRVKRDFETIAKVESEPRLEGKQMTMVNVTYPHNIIVRERERWAFSVRLTPEANSGINTWADAVDKHQHFILQ